MSTIKSSSEDLTLNADGAGNDIIFESNGAEKASLTDAGVFTATSFAGSGASLTGLPAHTGNVAFPATQVASADANTLDDYEEGSWTAVYEDGSGNAATMTANTGKYTKIGDLVWATFQCRSSSLGSMSGGVRITGLPFTTANNSTYPSASIGYFHHLDITAGQAVYGSMSPNTAYIELYLTDNGVGVTSFRDNELSSNGQIIGSISYKVA